MKLPIIDPQRGQTVQGPIGQVAVLVLVVALGGDHGAVVAAVFQLRQKDAGTQFLGTVVHQLAQAAVGGDAAGQHDLFGTGIGGSGEQLLGQDLVDALLFSPR